MDQRPAPVSQGETLEATIQKHADDGEHGIAFVKGGFVLFVYGARPGWTGSVVVERVSRNCAFARKQDPLGV